MVSALRRSEDRPPQQLKKRFAIELCADEGIGEKDATKKAWSDEATFYIWNDAAYTPQPGSGAFRSEDFQFGKAWPDPQDMIDRLHEKGIRLVLWQIPALKELEAGRSVPQHAADIEFALENGLVAINDDEARMPYRIPLQWFIGSYLPDFTNPALADWWMAKRQYLLEMGVDGFKTDGGEFVHDLSIRFADGSSGESMRNRYAAAYEKSYHALAGKERVLFSRAGYTGAQTASLHWAGDQLSTFSEMRAVLTAGLSLGLSGVPFWGFDIGGFAGPIPSAELYLRATALAVFSPIMQWHSEMVEGQYGAGSDGDANNDRSPWNIARRNNDSSVCEISVFFANLRMNLLPEIINQARIAQRDHLPMMRHLVLDYPGNPEAMHCDDQFLLGELLVAPVITEGANGRTVYLPEGDWVDFWSGKPYPGKSRIQVTAGLDRIPVFLRHGGAVLLNLAEDQTLGSPVGNQVGDYPQLILLTGGARASYVYEDKNGRSLRLTDGKLTSDLSSRLTVRNLEGMKML